MANGFTTITRAFRGGLKPKAARAYITPLQTPSDTPDEAAVRVFQYFPETITDTKASNYQGKVIPGLSHPLYQWTSGGQRLVSFQAIFTRDRALSDSEYKATRGVFTPDTVRIPVPGQANNFDSAAFGAGQGLSSATDHRNVDIPSAVAYLRSFMDPEYSQDGQGARSDKPRRPLPPRKLMLTMPGVRLNWGVPNLTANDMYCIMMTCDVSYVGFFGDGTPRMARVDLSFAEIIQVGGRITPHDAFNRRQFGVSGYTIDAKNIRD